MVLWSSCSKVFTIFSTLRHNRHSTARHIRHGRSHNTYSTCEYMSNQPSRNVEFSNDVQIVLYNLVPMQAMHLLSCFKV